MFWRAASRFNHDCITDGHRFEARYDTEPQLTDLKGSMSGYMAETLIRASAKKTYIWDICVRCGKTIKRKVE